MQSGIVKPLLLTFTIALVAYLAFFFLIEKSRQRKGPWKVTFYEEDNGTPAIQIFQNKLQIQNVKLSFPGGQLTNQALPQTVVFDRPITNIPFGQVLFLDTTFLPGTLTMYLFGHEVELIPRVLRINQQEVPWNSHSTTPLPATNTPPRVLKKK